MQPFARCYGAFCVLTTVVTILATPGEGRAQGATGASVSGVRDASIADARGAWFEADFEASRDGFLAVLAQPGLTPGDARDAHRYLAALFLVLDDEPRARAHAEAAVALDLEVAPPEGAPSRAADLFRMARRRLGGRAASISITPAAPLRAGELGRVGARLDPAPAELARSMRIRCDDVQAEAEGASVELELTPTQPVTCVASARTAQGAEVIVARTTLDVDGVAVADALPDAATRSTPERDAPWRGRRWAIATAVVALVAAGAVTGYLVYDRNHADVGFGGTTVVGW